MPASKLTQRIKLLGPNGAGGTHVLPIPSFSRPVPAECWATPASFPPRPTVHRTSLAPPEAQTPACLVGSGSRSGSSNRQAPMLLAPSTNSNEFHGLLGGLALPNQRFNVFPPSPRIGRFQPKPEQLWSEFGQVWRSVAEVGRMHPHVALHVQAVPHQLPECGAHGKRSTAGHGAAIPPAPKRCHVEVGHKGNAGHRPRFGVRGLCSPPMSLRLRPGHHVVHRAPLR